MKCPACGNPLQQMTVSDIAVDVCKGGCGGIWFDNFELKKFDEPHESLGEPLLDIERDESIVLDHYLLVRVYPGGLTQTFYNTPGIGHLLTGPAGPVKKIPEPEKVRWDSLYRWGRQEARNYSWRFGEPVTSTGIR